MTVAWEVSSLHPVHAAYPIMLAGGLQSCWPTPVLTRRRRWWVGIVGRWCRLPALGMPSAAAAHNKRPLGRSLSFWNSARTNAREIINLVSLPHRSPAAAGPLCMANAAFSLKVAVADVQVEKVAAVARALSGC